MCHFITFISTCQCAKPRVEEPVFVSDEVNIEPSLSNLKAPPIDSDSDSDSDIEDPPNWDPDSQTIWQRKLIKAWSERSEQIQLIENGKRELQEEREQIDSMRETVRLEMNNVKVERDKLSEIGPQISLARQLQEMGVDIGNYLPWNELVRKYATSHSVDLTTAAFELVRILEAFGELEFIQKEIKKSEAYWYALCNTIRDYKIAIKDLIYLRQTGCGKRELKRLTEIIRGKRLDEELISEKELGVISFRINGKKYYVDRNAQRQKNSNKVISPQQPNNNLDNQSDNQSMREWIRLNALKQKY